MKFRDFSFDGWKGIAIIAVIGIHACGEARTFAEGSANYWIGLIFRQLLNFAVPLFFALSGYFAPTADSMGSPGSGKAGRYYLSRLGRLWMPYLLWTIIYLLIRRPEDVLSLTELSKACFLGYGIGIGYFVVVLTTLIIIHPWIVRMQSRILLLSGAVATFFTLILVYYFRWEQPEALFSRFRFYALPFTTWLFFYVLGFAFKRYGDLGYGRKIILTLTGFSFAASIAESAIFLTQTHTPSVALSQVKLSSYLYSTFVIICVLSFGRRWVKTSKYLVWVGQRSYAIYLTHMLFLGVVMSGLNSIEPIRLLQAVYIPIASTAGLLLTSVFIYCAEKLLPQELRSPLLGARPIPASVVHCRQSIETTS
jgi:Fucose 4-O-acetylase and related acetyltransferases